MTVRTRAGWLAAALLAPMLVAGCGEDSPTVTTEASRPPATATPTATEAVVESPPPPSAPEIDPCALLTKEEAEQLADLSLQDPVATPTSCTYTSPPVGPTAQVELYVGDGAKKVLDIDQELGHEFRELEGLGDEALMEDGMVFIRKGSVWVGLRLFRLDDPEAQAKRLEEAARIVAGRF